MSVSKFRREIRAVLRDLGAENIAIYHPGRCTHPRVEFDFAGRRYSRVIAGTPSDNAAVFVAARALRRMVAGPRS